MLYRIREDNISKWCFWFVVNSVQFREGSGTPLQYFARSWTRLSDFTLTFHFHALEKEMATHSRLCLENPRDGGAWWAAVYGVAQSRTRLKRLRSSSSSSSVQSLSHVRLFMTPWTVTCQASLSRTNFQSLFRLMSNESMMPSNHLILFHPLLFLPSIFPNIRVFSNESVICIR